jgi:hypothetical protein
MDTRGMSIRISAAAALFCFVAWGTGQGSTAVAAGSNRPALVASAPTAPPALAALLEQRQRFVAAVRARHWSSVRAATIDYGLGADWQLRLDRGYAGHVLDQRAAGLELQSERLVGGRLLRRGNGVLGVLDVRATWRHPLHPGGRTTINSRVFAVSTDGGVRWKFNVLDCFEDLHLERTWPGAAALLKHAQRDAADPAA